MRYQLKTPYRGGTTQVVFEPIDSIARLAALAPYTPSLSVPPEGLLWSAAKVS